MNDLNPHISAETLEFHFGRHHKNYIDTLNSLISGSRYGEMTLEDIVKSSEGTIFNNAGQAWNHTFYWNCMTAASKAGKPSGLLADTIQKSFGSENEFLKQFVETAKNNFGSGWTWAVKDNDGIKILSTKDADTPIKNNQIPILTCDDWEHAYYIDYRNERGKYLDGFTRLINWAYVDQCFSSLTIPNLTPQMT
jgi:superoxide dismutase, Fe-Mn family